MKSFLKEFVQFLIVHKWYWLSPIVLFVLILLGLVFFLETAPVAPFTYTVF